MQYYLTKNKKKKIFHTYIENTSKNKLIVLLGPTAGKKSALAREIQEKYNYDVVNCDIYKAYKDSETWVNQIPKGYLKHDKFHIYGTLDPFQEMNVAIFQKICRDKIDELLKKNNVVLIGGSCLYMNAIVFKEYNFSHVGKQKRPDKFTNFFPNTSYIGLKWEREEIYELISNRVNNMFRFGILGPEKILKKYPGTLLAKAIGYKEWKAYLEGEQTKEEVLETIKTNTRRYAKRQLTWYRHQYSEVEWYDITLKKVKEVFENILEDIE